MELGKNNDSRIIDTRRSSLSANRARGLSNPCKKKERE
jgi:hypothetical protein